MARMTRRRVTNKRKKKLNPKSEIEPFDYSPAEWTEINSVVTASRGTSLGPAEKRSLLRAANLYRRDTIDREAGAYATPRARADSWAKVAKLCSQLSGALEVAGRNRQGDGWRTTPIIIVKDPLRAALAKKLFNDPFATLESPYGGVLDIGDILELLAHLRGSSEETAQPFYWGISLMVSHSGRQDPRIIFFQHILWLWTDIFGGKLRFSRNPQSGKLSGPLLRFFLSVAGPVMAENVPAIQSIPDIVRRQRAFSHWLDEYMVLCGSDRTELAKARLLGGDADNGEV